ncbi:MAG: Fur family transcriptional regulator [Pseudomonadota bacterium]
MGHDHAIAQIAAQAEAKGLRLTPVRRRTLELLHEGGRAKGAYDLLEMLKPEGLGKTPVSVYRALDFLVEHGFAHKIEGLNAFVACGHTHAGHDHAPAFLVCRDCRRVDEAHLAPQDTGVGGAALKAGFTVERIVVEALGLCADCATQ